MVSFVKAHDYTIGEYIQGLNAVIPTYQRSYEWGPDQVGIFLEDLYSELEESEVKSSQYFLGPIITTNDSSSEEKQIIDGQQRLTTITILLAVIRDSLKNIDGKASARLEDRIVFNFIGEGTDDSKFKLTQRGPIEEYFRDHIQKYDPDSPAEEKKIFTGSGSKGKGKVNNVIRAYNLIFQFINEKTNNFEDDENKFKHLKDVFEVLTKNLFIVEIWAPNRSEAFQIFQTINARGLDLSAADLIKADFFGNSGENTSQVLEMWDDIQRTIGDLQYSDLIRYAWNSIDKFTTKRRLYKSVSKRINSPEKIFDFMKMLQKVAPAYAELNEDPTITFLPESEAGKNIKNIFQELNSLKFKTYIPIYIAMVNQDYDDNSMLTILKKVTSLLIRNKIMARGTNWLEKFLSEKARKINESSDNINKVINEIINEIDNEMPKDSIVTAQLNSYEYEDDTNLVRFILRAIENENLGEKGLVEMDNRKVHVEHIMPKNPLSFEDWDVTMESHEEYLWRLGNLTLWLGTSNSSVKNAGFEEKMEIYSKSDLNMTRKLSELDHWDTKKIDERTEEIIKKFLSIY